MSKSICRSRCFVSAETGSKWFFESSRLPTPGLDSYKYFSNLAHGSLSADTAYIHSCHLFYRPITLLCQPQFRKWLKCRRLIKGLNWQAGVSGCLRWDLFTCTFWERVTSSHWTPHNLWFLACSPWFVDYTSSREEQRVKLSSKLF